MSWYYRKGKANTPSLVKGYAKYLPETKAEWDAYRGKINTMRGAHRDQLEEEAKASRREYMRKYMLNYRRQANVRA
jgi:hypothetical protein